MNNVLNGQSNNMKPELIPGLALVLSGMLLAIPLTASQLDAANDKNLHWGEQVGGFQLAAMVDMTNAVVHCWIRNATTNEVEYPSFDFGYREFISLDFFVKSNWESIHYWIYPGGNTMETPPPYYTKKIGPGQIICETNWIVFDDNHAYKEDERHRLISQIRPLFFGGGAYDEAGYKRAVSKIESRWMQMTNSCNADTFALDFLTTNQFATAPVFKARACQKFRKNAKGETMVLFSPQFDCPFVDNNLRVFLSPF